MLSLLTDCYAWNPQQLCEASIYYQTGFSALQLALDTAIQSVCIARCPSDSKSLVTVLLTHVATLKLVITAT